MTSATSQMITRCPKCGTAFRVTQSQLQSAKGAVRCGSCLNVFQALDYAVPTSAATEAKPAESAKGESATAASQSPANKPVELKKADLSSLTSISSTSTPPTPKPLTAEQAPRSTTQTTPGEPPETIAAPAAINTDDSDELLISDDMEEAIPSGNSYEFDGFVDMDLSPKSEVSLFERKLRKESEDYEQAKDTDESWAEMLIDEEEETLPQLGIMRPKTDEQLADDALSESRAVNPDSITASNTPATPPGLVFSLVGETGKPADDELILSDELANMPSHQGFKAAPAKTAEATESAPEAAEAMQNAAASTEEAPKRQLKTQPKIRAYDGSRAALLMNIIPAPIEFTAKSVHRWYQRKLWPSLSLLALLALAAQIAWFKFDYFSRIEPYRTAYLFACPYLGCQVPTLIDTRQITTSNLVVREHPDTAGALAVDVMIINGAQFDQPFPDLVLVFSDINDKLVASRRFTPKDYLGGELVGRELMPRNQKVYITLDLVDPGAEAVNYRIYIPQ